MRRLISFAACCLLLSSAAVGQAPRKDGWGPWQWTESDVSAIRFRSKCVSDDGEDSKWKYQFRSFSGLNEDFVEREEHGVTGTTRNELSPSQVFTLNVGAVSPVFESTVHGTCAEVRELKVEVLCVTRVDLDNGDLPCFKDDKGRQVDPKPVPSNPKYE